MSLIDCSEGLETNLAGDGGVFGFGSTDSDVWTGSGHSVMIQRGSPEPKAENYMRREPVCDVSYPASNSNCLRKLERCKTSRKDCAAGDSSVWRSITRS